MRGVAGQQPRIGGSRVFAEMCETRVSANSGVGGVGPLIHPKTMMTHVFERRLRVCRFFGFIWVQTFFEILPRHKLHVKID